MPSRWNARLATGIPSIDTVHLEMLGIIDDTLAGRASLPTVSGATRHFDLFDAHVSQHFVVEEAHMLQRDFLDMFVHRAEHVRLAEGLAELRREVAHRRSSLEDLVKANRLVCNWLQMHIRTSDREFARFLQAQKHGGRSRVSLARPRRPSRS